MLREPCRQKLLLAEEAFTGCLQVMTALKGLDEPLYCNHQRSNMDRWWHGRFWQAR